MPTLLLLLLAACSPEHLPAADYCETSADRFCNYYLRCDRMVAAGPEDCRSTFLETCNERYEPHYEALEDEGLLALSSEGLDTCFEHLGQVACDEQIHDLQGPCAAVWEGLAPAGAACGLGIESFVCDAESTCVIGMDLCGTCEPAADAGEACGDEVRCHADAACVDGTCVARALPGAACGADQPCVLGAWCTDGTCEGPSWVGVGEACDATHRCRYRAACVGGSCVEAALLGEDCADHGVCASGWCDGATCRALKAGGEACEQGAACHSGICGDDGTCVALPGVCLE